MQGASSLQAAPPASHTRSCAPARGYPSCTHGQDAANATRHCNTQPVCWPQREPSAAPLAGTSPAGAQPPSSEHPRGLAASTHLGVSLCTRGLVPGSPGTLHIRGLGSWGQLRAFCPADWGSACLGTWLSGKLVPPRGSGRAGALEALPPGVRRCQSVPPAAHQPLPTCTELPQQPWTVHPWQQGGCLNCPSEGKQPGWSQAGQHSALELICCATFG